MSLEQAKVFLGSRFYCFAFPKKLMEQRGVNIAYVFPSFNMLRYFFRFMILSGVKYYVDEEEKDYYKKLL